jgi:hypothetical protein
MQLNPTTFHIDPTPRRADGEYMAHARISKRLAGGEEFDLHVSGDLAGFDARADAILFAKEWAVALLDSVCASGAG